MHSGTLTEEMQGLASDDYFGSANDADVDDKVRFDAVKCEPLHKLTRRTVCFQADAQEEG